MLQTIFGAYISAFDAIPQNFRTIAAVVVIAILVWIFVGFVRKSLVWLLIFILLVPTAYPAIKQISLSVYHGVIAPLIK